MCDKLNTNFGNKPNFPKYERPKGNEEIFTINHYAGRVMYTGAGFLDKNRDTISLDVIATFLGSDKELVEDIFNEDSAEDKAKAKAAKKKAGRGTIRKKLDKVRRILLTNVTSTSV
jgi:myosin heavy subunit